jgi:oxygen-independent coproporphyrinogen-3 oxidase
MQITNQDIQFTNNINPEILNHPLSIYIHWPFCLSKCPYCDFNSHLSKKVNTEEWIKSYLIELEYFKKYFFNRKINSIYFGGGTPSLMDPEIIYEILNFIKSNAIFDDNIEITLEANPTSSEYKKFQSFKNAGINRVSIGIQSLIAEDLKFLGRNHSATEGMETIAMAKEIFPRYSFDLIYARPNQTLDSWEKELRQAMDLAHDHISLYQLTIEKGTKFYQMYKQNQFILPKDDLSNDLYFLTDKILAEYGFSKYEISNYSKNDQYSKHNMCYWFYDDYLGIGPGAHGRLRQDHDKFYAFNQIYQPQNWLDSIEQKQHGIQKYELLEKHDVISEIILTGLRLQNGIQQKKSIEKIGNKVESFIKPQTLSFLINENLVKYDNDYFSTTERGFRILDYVISTIINNLFNK